MSDDEGASPEADPQAAESATHEAGDADTPAAEAAEQPEVDGNQPHFVEAWSSYDPSLRFVAIFPVGEEQGAAASSVAYYVIEPGRHSGLHSDNVEEIVFVTEGYGEVYIMGGSRTLEAGQFQVFPADVPHDVYAKGGVALRLLSFFPTAEIVSTYQETMFPMGQPVITSRRPGGRMVNFGPDGLPINLPATEGESGPEPAGEGELSAVARAIGLDVATADEPELEEDADAASEPGSEG